MREIAVGGNADECTLSAEAAELMENTAARG